MNRAVLWLADLVFPNRCPFCSGFIPWNDLICSECEQKLETDSFCPACGKQNCICGSRKLDYDGCAVVRPYTGTVRHGILELKYRYGFNTAKYLAVELVSALDKCGFLSEDAVITAVPMTKRRRRETGYNQAEYIAKELSRLTGIKYDFKLIDKNRNAAVQHRLSAGERRVEAEKVYLEYKKHTDIRGKTVILCDDIITTGSTLSSCASVLKIMGAEKVYCAVLAGTPLRDAGVSENN